MDEISECLKMARSAVQISDQVGSNEQETREIRTALRALIQAVEALHSRHK